METIEIIYPFSGPELIEPEVEEKQVEIPEPVQHKEIHVEPEKVREVEKVSKVVLQEKIEQKAPEKPVEKVETVVPEKPKQKEEFVMTFDDLKQGRFLHHEEKEKR